MILDFGVTPKIYIKLRKLIQTFLAGPEGCDRKTFKQRTQTHMKKLVGIRQLDKNIFPITFGLR
jgi:hypothetical protein